MVLMTASDYSRYRGVSPQFISKLKRRGLLNQSLNIKPGCKKVMIDAEKADRILKEVLNPSYLKGNRMPAVGSGKSSTSRGTKDQRYFLAKTESELYESKNRQLAYEQKKAKYISRNQVKSEAAEVIKIIKNVLQKTSQAAAAKVSKSNNEFECLEILNSEFTQACREIVKKMKAAKT